MRADSDFLKDNNAYFKILAGTLCNSIAEYPWRSLRFDFSLYEPEGDEAPFSTMELTLFLEEGGRSVRTPSEVYEVVKGLRRSMDIATGSEWTSMNFELDSDGEMDVDFGYERLIYDVENDAFYD